MLLAPVVSSEGQQYNGQPTFAPSWYCLSEGVDITHVSLGSISKSTSTDNTLTTRQQMTSYSKALKSGQVYVSAGVCVYSMHVFVDEKDREKGCEVFVFF